MRDEYDYCIHNDIPNPKYYYRCYMCDLDEERIHVDEESILESGIFSGFHAQIERTGDRAVLQNHFDSRSHDH